MKCKAGSFSKSNSFTKKWVTLCCVTYLTEQQLQNVNDVTEERHLDV